MSDRWKVADLVVDLTNRKVTRGVEDLDVRGLTFDLLCALVAGRGDVVSVGDLITTVWDAAPITNEVITQRVRLLRRALGDDPAAPRYIETVRQRGYRLCASVTPAAKSAAPARSGRRPGPWLVAAVLVAVGLALTLISRSPSVDPLLERARYYAGSGQSEDNLRAIDLYEQLLIREPDSYGAALGLSFALSQRVCRHDDQPELLDRARALVTNLQVRAPKDPDVIAALAYVDDCAGQIDSALEGYLAAYALDDTHMASLGSAAYLMQVRGRLAESLEANLRIEAQSRDRPFRYTQLQIARCLDLMTFDRAAHERYRSTVQLFPDNLFAAAGYVRFLLSRGDLDEALAVAERAVRLRAVSAELLAYQGELYLLRDQREAAVDAFDAAKQATQTTTWPQTLLDIYADTDVPPRVFEARIAMLRAAVEEGNRWPDSQLEMGLMFQHLGRFDEAFAALDDAMTHGFRDVAYLEASPLFATLRQQPAFADLARRMRAAAASERDRALAADWWRPDIIETAEP